MTIQKWFDASGHNWAIAGLQTAAICALIAFLIHLINGVGFWLNFWFALGYGMPIFLASSWLTSRRQARPEWQLLLFSFSVGLLIGSINLYSVLHLSPWFDHAASDLNRLAANIFMSALFSLAGFYFFYSRYRLHAMQMQLSEQARLAAEQERALVQSQLQQLQNQIEPHFLFNTLANIQVLIDQQPKDAKAMLSALSHMLRANLHQVRGQKTVLADEIALLESYLAIQRIRMGNRLVFELQVDEQLLSLPMPPLMLQPLVENAIQHGLEPKAEGGCIWLRFYRSHEQVVLEVEDNGLGQEAKAHSRGQGMALANIAQRLDSLYQGQARLVLNAPAEGFKARILLPMWAEEAGHVS